MSSESDNIPSDIEEIARSGISSVIPNKSRAQYDLAYTCHQKKWEIDVHKNLFLYVF
jgi:hypothetical protein